MPLADDQNMIQALTPKRSDLAAPVFGPPMVGVVYLLCEVPVLRSNSEKQRFEFAVVSVGCASLVRDAAPAPRAATLPRRRRAA
jgi:hypothetical protein